MLKKRVIFTLLYDSGHFMLSRNFRLQRVGDHRWLKRHYDFAKIAFFIDELIVLDVTRGQRDTNGFSETLKAVVDGCFVPVAAGGGIRTMAQAKLLLRSGADKIVVNTPLFDDSLFVRNLGAEFGQQCVVGSVDMKREVSGDYAIYVDSGGRRLGVSPREALKVLTEDPVGELYLNSIDRDGTGQGYDLGVLRELPQGYAAPVILAGGVGNATHLADGLRQTEVDAVATAHLFNFVGDGLQRAREILVQQGNQLARWPSPAVYA